MFLVTSFSPHLSWSKENLVPQQKHFNHTHYHREWEMICLHSGKAFTFNHLKTAIKCIFLTCDSITIKPQNSKDPVKSVRTVLLWRLPPSDGFLRKCQRANEWEWNNLRTTHGVYFPDVLFPENLFKWFHVLFLYKEIHFCNFVLEVLRNDTFRNKFGFIFFIRLMLLWERWHFRNCWKGTVCFTANYKSRNL